MKTAAFTTESLSDACSNLIDLRAMVDLCREMSGQLSESMKCGHPQELCGIYSVLSIVSNTLGDIYGFLEERRPQLIKDTDEAEAGQNAQEVSHA